MLTLGWTSELLARANALQGTPRDSWAPRGRFRPARRGYESAGAAENAPGFPRGK